MLLHKIKCCLLAIFLFSICFNLNAQNRFKGGAIFGFNASQMTGDKAAGYHKVGLNAGLRAIILLKPKTDITLDLLYSQRGSRTTQDEALEFRSVTLHYLEIPVLFHYKDWLETDKSGASYYRASIEAGISYGRLFNTDANDAFKLLFYHPLEKNKLTKNDISVTAGITFMFSAHWGLAARMTQSLNRLYDPNLYLNDPILSGYEALKSYFASFQTIYIF
jgi:Outer membrane protein beta-barrel domain